MANIATYRRFCLLLLSITTTYRAALAHTAGTALNEKNDFSRRFLSTADRKSLEGNSRRYTPRHRGKFVSCECKAPAYNGYWITPLKIQVFANENLASARIGKQNLLFREPKSILSIKRAPESPARRYQVSGNFQKWLSARRYFNLFIIFFIYFFFNQKSWFFPTQTWSMLVPDRKTKLKKETVSSGPPISLVLREYLKGYGN